MKRTFCFVILLIASLLLSDMGWPQEVKPKSLEGVEFFTGFGWGKLRRKGNYHLIPLIVDFDFDLKPLAKKFNFNPSSLLQFQVEPFISPVLSPDSNVEI